MKPGFLTTLVAVAGVAGLLELSAAETVRLRHAASVYQDDKGGGLRRPEGVACSDAGQVVVADTGNDRLVRFVHRDGELTGGTEIRIPQLAAPNRVQLSAKGEIYALDGKQRRIVRLGAEGGYKGVIGFAGVPPPAGVVVKSFRLGTSDALYVLDVFSARVLVLDADGTFQKALPLPGDASFVTDIDVDAAGRVLALDSIGRRLYVAAHGSDRFDALGGDLSDALQTMPTHVIVSRGLIFVLESGGSIATIGQDGAFLGRQLRQGWQDGALNHPAQGCVTDGDRLFIADRDNSRIQVFAVAR